VGRAALIGLIALLAGCGQTGPLFLPDDGPDPATPAAAPTTDAGEDPDDRSEAGQ
jgi:predicted small lipoprotein YifL